MRFVDLFAGIGGFHLAANQVFGESGSYLGGSEIDITARNIYNKYFSFDHEIGGDIRELVSGAPDEWNLPQFDLCLAGFPCQPFSNVGKRNGLSDPRSWVFYDLVRVIEYYRPKYFVFENVEKIKTLEGGAVLNSLTSRLDKSGYQVDTFILCAKDYGLPQQRKRIFFCGRRRGKSKTMKPLPTPKTKLLMESIYPTTWHILERDMPIEHEVPLGSRKTIFTKNEKWMGDLDIDRTIARPICATMGKWHRANQ
ncbi:MAG: DNA (cytosine-5-)-methyltransferase, partial [Desulfuromonadaceae bacterium]|nr:DNA (cytosine-5-)-methyltransferase [Desulfuromonadaceae bacterium]